MDQTSVSEPVNAHHAIDPKLIALAKKQRVTFVKEPIKPFSIMFEDACPLDLSITKYCFQGCEFCFANLNRKAANSMRGEIEDPTDKVIKLIQKSNGPGFDPTRFMEWCIRSNYPICFSNNVDPFMPASEEQYKCGERILRTCDEFGQRLVIQTKEVFYNDNIRDLIIANRENFQMYVSISTIDFEQSQKYETVLVPPMERLRRIEILAKAGVHVCVGLNPYVPEWIPNARDYCKALADHGVKGIFTSPLHFSRKQKTVVDKKRMGKYVEMANRFDQHEEDMETVWRAMCNFFGLQLYYPTMQKRTMDFHHGITAFPMDETWPMQRGWIMCEIRKLYDEVKRPIEIRWQDFSDFYDEQDEWSNPFKVDDIGMVVCHVTEQHKAFRSSLGKLNNFANISKLIWNNPELFDAGIDSEYDVYRKGILQDDGYIAETDESGNLIYVYDPDFSGEFNVWDQDIQKREPVNINFGD